MRSNFEIDAGDGRPYLTFFCPGCAKPHRVPVDAPVGFHWNGVTDFPSLHPAVEVDACCAIIREGRISFTAGSGHKLAGSEIDLPDIS